MPVNPVTAGLYFSLGELNYAAGQRVVARQLWQKIVQQGAPELPEVAYARSRLDNRKTETDKLWGLENIPKKSSYLKAVTLYHSKIINLFSTKR